MLADSPSSTAACSASPDAGGGGARRAELLVLAFALLITLPTLGMGFMMDDYAQLALVEGWYPSHAGAFGLYAFLDQLPFDPWWKHPELRIEMWRPLPSLLLQLDNRLFGSWPVGYHLHSLLWYLAVLWVSARLYRRWLGGGLAVLALLVFALDESHLLTASWIANRHSMVAMVPALLGLAAHLRWREDDWAPGLPLSLLGFGVGLLGGEMALGAMAYALSYELFAAPPRRRWLAAMPMVALGAIYALAYKVMGFGAAHSGFYLDPLGDPVAFARNAAGHLPTLLGAALAGLPSDLWFFVPQLRPLQIGLGVVASLAAVWLLWRSWGGVTPHERRMLRWLIGGALLSLLPVTAAQPFDRVLIVPMIGLSALIAVVLRALWRARRETSRSVMLLALLGFIHLVVPTTTRLAGQWLMDQQWEAISEVALALPITTREAPGSDVVVLTAPDIIVGGFLPLIYGFEHRLYFHSWQILSLAPYDHRLYRTGPRRLELEVLAGHLLTSPPERFHRVASSPLRVGERIATPHFEVEILAADRQGPTRVAFSFPRTLEAPDLVFLTWSGRYMERFVLPAVGQSVVLPRQPGAMAVAWAPRD